VAEVPTSPTAPSTQPLTVGPISYFEDHCARCHGSYGSGYLPESMQRHDAAGLKKLIRDMAAGPAQAPLEEADLDAQVAYHIALLNQSLFITITERTATTLTGEATPGAILHLKTGDRIVDVPLDEFAWSLSLEGVNSAEAILILENSSGRLELPLSQQGQHVGP
jgi:hypothetical protein